jgi:hypothetical protein
VAELDPDSVSSRADFVAFVRSLSDQDPQTWENPTTTRYLEGLAAWVEDWPQELTPSWRDFALAIIAATEYE